MKTRDPVKLGAALYQRKGCVVCHSITVDAAYIRTSVRALQAQARPGYPPSMPTFDDSVLRDRELDAIVAYLESLR